MFTVLLACGGGEIILLPLLLIVGALWLSVKVAGYYVVGRSLALAHPELEQTPAELMGARLGAGMAGLLAAVVAGRAAGSFAVMAAALATMRFATWIWFERFFIAPHVPLAGLEQAGWAAAGTAWSFFLDLVAAGLCVGLWYLLAAALS